MSSKTSTNQAGIAIIIIVFGIALVGAGVTLGFARVQESNNNKAALQNEKLADQEAAALKTHGSKLQKEKPEQTTTPGPQTPPPAPAAAPTPASQVKPAPAPAPAAPHITPFNKSEISCTDYTTAYASKSGGTPLYKTYSLSEVAATIPYGAPLQINCPDGDAAGAAYGGAPGAISLSDVSKTKP